MNKEVVLLVYYDPSTQKILSEKRSSDSKFYPNQPVFPAGTIEEEEKDDVSKTLIRESQEEFGVTPTEFVSLDGDSPLISGDGLNVLHIYLTTRWEGTFSDEVLDKGNPLIWETLDEVSSSTVEYRATIAERVRNHLDQQTEMQNL